MLDSGNADRDAQLFGAGLASQEYDKWLTNLLGFTNPELSATSGAATGRATGMRSLADLGVREADLETTLGRNLAGVETGRAGMLADLQRTLAGTYPAEGAALAGINTGAANAVVNAYNAAAPGVVDSYKQEGDAAMQGSKNLINFGMNVASLAAGGLGGMGGLGSLGSLFGGSSFSGLGGNPNQSMAGVDPYGQFYNYA